METRNTIAARPAEFDRPAERVRTDKAQPGQEADRQRQAPAPEQAAAAAAASANADLRLVIEEVAAGRFVYKTVDRRTGEVVQQMPREELVKLSADEDYRAGRIINAQA